MSAPRLARWLIRLTAAADRRDDTLGDLEEAHRRRVPTGRLRAWFATSVEGIVIALALLWDRVRSLAGGGRAMSPTDLRLGLRLMYRQPVLTLTAILALTIGIGLATAGFAFMETVLYSRLPFEGGDRFYAIRAVQEPGGRAARLRAEDYQRIRSSATTLEHLGAISSSRTNVVLPSGDVETVVAAGLTPTSFGWLPYGQPIAGRLLVPSDGRADAPPVAMVRKSFWERALAGADDVVGSTLVLAGITRTIVGVVPDEYQFPNEPDVYTPIGEDFLDGRGLPESDADLFGVVAPGRSLATVQDQLNVIANDIPGAAEATGPVRLTAVSFTDLGPQGRILAGVVVAIVLALMVVIAANVGNLILARSLARTREFALRAALGASRRRLVGQVFVEVLLLGSVAAVIGALGAQAIMRQFNSMDEIPYWVDFGGGPRTAVMVACATLLATALAGAWPALRATRRDLASGLQGGDGRTSEVAFGRMAGGMVVVQIAMSVVMLHGALVLGQSFAAYADQSLDLPREVLTSSLSVNATRPTPGGERVTVTAADVEAIALDIPGVVAAGLTTALPRHSPRALEVELEVPSHAPIDGPAVAPSAEVTAGYFRALGAKILAGRDFAASDYLPGAYSVAVVNEPFVERFFGPTSPVGQRFRVHGFNGPGPWQTVVGVVPDLGLSMGDPTFAAGFYTPLGTDTNFVYLALRITGEPVSYAMPLRRALLERDPNLVINRTERLEDVAQEDRTAFAVMSASLLGLGAITLVLALAGVYAMMSLIVTRRTREIGIRVALGATTSKVIRSIVGRAAWQVAIGGMLGSGLAILSMGFRANLVSRIADGAPWTLPAVAILLVLAGLAATWIPVQRALAVRPFDALRAE